MSEAEVPEACTTTKEDRVTRDICTYWTREWRTSRDGFTVEESLWKGLVGHILSYRARQRGRNGLEQKDVVNVYLSWCVEDYIDRRRWQFYV